MFESCNSLTSFNSDLSSIENGSSMFYECRNLKQFTSDLSSLSMGAYMFVDCPKLQFVSDLSSLKSGLQMFNLCKLDIDSLTHIAETINNLVENGMAYRDDETSPWKYNIANEKWCYKTVSFDESLDNPIVQIDTNSVDQSYRGKLDIWYDPKYVEGSKEHEEVLSLAQQISDKGWTVTLNCVSDDETQNLNNTLLEQEAQQRVTPIVHWFKPVNSDELHGTHINENGQFFMIQGGRYVFGDDMSAYGQFTSLAQAEQAMGLTKVERQRKRVR